MRKFCIVTEMRCVVVVGFSAALCFQTHLTQGSQCGSTRPSSFRVSEPQFVCSGSTRFTVPSICLSHAGCLDGSCMYALGVYFCTRRSFRCT